MLLVTGQRIPLSAADFWGIFFSRSGAVFYLIIFLLVLFVYPIEIVSGEQPQWWAKLVGLGIMFSAFPVIFALLLTVIAAFSARWRTVTVFEPALSLIIIIVLQSNDSFLMPLILGDQWLKMPSFADRVVNAFMAHLIFDAMFCFFVLPLIVASGDWRQDEGALEGGRTGLEAVTKTTIPADQMSLSDPAPPSIDSQPDPATKEETVDLDGKGMPLSHVLAVETDDHYVRVWTQDGELYFRQSFSALTTRLGTSAGFIPRRGIWVSFSNINSIRKDDSGKYVVTPFKGPLAIVPKAKSSELRRILKNPPLGMSFDTQGNATRR